MYGIAQSATRTSSPCPTYRVHIIIERNRWNDVTPRDPEKDNQTGDGTHDPEQFGTVFLSIEGMDEACPEYPDDEEINYVQTRGKLVDLDRDDPEYEWGYPMFLHSWNDELVNGYPSGDDDPDDPYTNEDSAYEYDHVFCVPWEDIEMVPWTGRIRQLAYSIDPWDDYRMVVRWLKAALFAGVAPQKEPGTRRTPTPPPAPRREDSDDNEPLNRRAVRLGL